MVTGFGATAAAAVARRPLAAAMPPRAPEWDVWWAAMSTLLSHESDTEGYLFFINGRK